MAKNQLNQWSLALLRVVLGYVFAYHGYLKLFAPGIFSGTVKFFASIGIPFALYAALVVAVVEFAGGLFLIFGLLTRLSASLLIIDMLVALFKVHLKNGFLVGQGGYELVIVLIAGLVVVFACGAGRLAIGKQFKSKILK